MRKLGGVILNKSPLEKSEVQGSKGFSVSELLKQLVSCGDAVYIFSHWGLPAMLVFPNWPLVVLPESSPFWSPDSVLVNFPFINFTMFTLQNAWKELEII